MPSKKENQKDADAASLEDIILLPSGDQPLDVDLTDRTNADPRETPLDISLISDPVPVQDGGDLTILPGKRHLKKISSSNNMNVLELQAKRIIHPDMEEYRPESCRHQR